MAGGEQGSSGAQQHMFDLKLLNSTIFLHCNADKTGCLLLYSSFIDQYSASVDKDHWFPGYTVEQGLHRQFLFIHISTDMNRFVLMEHKTI